MLEDKECLFVSDEAKQSTQYCTKDFACLNGNRDVLCKVEKCFREHVLFVACLQQGYCCYQRRYGFTGYVCTCPVRMEIYKEYHI
jgi:hypothetical protein